MDEIGVTIQPKPYRSNDGDIWRPSGSILVQDHKGAPIQFVKFPASDETFDTEQEAREASRRMACVEVEARYPGTTIRWEGEKGDTR